MILSLKQAWVIVRSAWQRNLNYRFTVLMYRLGEVVEVLIVIFMWTAIYAGGSTMIKGFTLPEMITYVLMGNLFAVAVRNFLPGHVSRDITDGRLSMFLVKPISYISYTFVNELGRIFLSTVISIFTQALVIVFFLDKIVFNTDVRYWGVIIVMVFLAFVIELLLGFLVGSIAFWTDEVDGIQSSLERIKKFFAGGYFPISLLPAMIGVVSMYLPFGYSFFVPAQLFLKNISLREGLFGLLVQVIWIGLLSLILTGVWKLGLRRYEATGS